MAAPYVAGVATLVWQANPALTNVQLRDNLNQTATDLGDSLSFGNGLVDALKALSSVVTITVSR